MSKNCGSFQSDRKFVLFSYSASHGALLLRSGKTNIHQTRVDVLLQDVRAMEVRAWSDGLQIEEAGVDYLQGFRSNPAEMIEAGNKVYSVRGAGWEGFVVGGIISYVEDEKNFSEPSRLLGE